MGNKLQQDNTLPKNVALMTSNKKSIELDGKPVYDTELIYTRVICLQQYRDFDITDVLFYDLSLVPASLFDESGAMRAQSNKVLKTKLQVGSKEHTRCCHQRWMCHVVDSAWAHKWHR